MKFILAGCSLLKMLCFTPTCYEGGGINDDFISKMFSEHPCKHLEIFCFERSFLSEQTFFYLLSNMPNIKYIGNMGEWTIDRRAKLGLKAFIKGNNINVDIDSFNYGQDCDFSH